MRRAIAEGTLDRGENALPLLIDAYLDRSGIVSDSTLLWTAYRTMLARANHYRDDTTRAFVDRHVQLAELVLPTPIRANTLPDERANTVLEWWLSQEAQFLSGRHERLAQHLGRVANARMRFANPLRPTGLDARGETLVRYGSPSRVRTVRFNEAELTRSFLRDGLPVRLRDFPDNEVWVYDQFGLAGLFMFVEGNDGYRLGAVNDLLPRQLRSRGVGGSARGGAYAIAGLRALRHILAQLAMFHPAYGPRYDIVAGYVGRQEERVIEARGFRGRPGGGSADELSRTLESALSRNHADDGSISEQRMRTLPASYSLSERVGYQPDLRPVRFRLPEGETEVVVYWTTASSEEATCVLPDESHPKRVRLVNTRSGQELRQRVYASAPGETASVALPFNAAFTTGDVALHLGPAEEQSAVAERLRLCSGGRRLAPLEPLATSGTVVSDLLPFTVDDVVLMRGRLAEGFGREAVAPRAGRSLSGEEAIGLYFEVYPPGEGVGEYLLTYETIAVRRGGILRREQREASLFQSRRFVENEALPAAFLIDAASWAQAERLEVVVTVTDLNTGDQVSRRADFSVGR